MQDQVPNTVQPKINSNQEVMAEELQELQKKVASHNLPEELKRKALDMLKRVRRMVNTGVYSQEYDRISHYIDWITSLPWSKYSEDKIDIINAQNVLNSTHHGMKEPKNRILEYLATLKLKSDQGSDVKIPAPALFLVGLVGTGKTTFAYAIAQTMGRSFARIPFGGLGSARDLRGRSRLFPEAEPGALVKAIKNSGHNNPVILLDEIDRVSTDQRADIMGVLVEILDPTQNNRFLDHYIDHPIDLSQVLFIATANNTANIATAVLDRLEVIQMPSYTDEEKIEIGKNFLFPTALKESGLKQEQVKIEESIWSQIVRPLGFDAGIRTLERTIEGIARKVALQIVEGKTQSITINQDNYKEYIKTY